MKHLQKLYEQLCFQQELHANEIYNYTIPEAWNLYGYAQGIRTKQKEIIIDPYNFTKFTLEHLIREPQVPLMQGNWLPQSVMYYQITRISGAWDHDRSTYLEKDNLYHMNEYGTFLKAILRLPLYQRMGFNTILLSAPFALGNSNQHPFSSPHAIKDFQHFDKSFHDPLLGDYSIEDEYLAFEECAHHLGIRIIWQMDIGTMARDNVYLKEHPEWFYWLHTKDVSSIHTPNISYLNKNYAPEKDIKQIFQDHEEVQEYYKLFQDTPKNNIDGTFTTIPFLHDRINSELPIEYDYTPLRFYTDTVYSDPFTLRADLYPGKQKNKALWKMLKDQLTAIQQQYHMDGFLFTRIYLLPDELLKECIKIIKKAKNIVLVEDNAQRDWKDYKVDGISGNSAYVEYDVWNHQLHNFVYRLKDNSLPMFAGAEFQDTLRITQYENEALTILLHTLNLFLPNSIPFYVTGMECMEKQPIALSYFQDQTKRNALSQNDIRFLKQPMLDEYYFEYRHDGIYKLSHLFEQLKTIRASYIDAITNPEACVPLWFDSPNDPAIGFAYISNHSALIMIANTDIERTQYLHAHLENLFIALPSSEKHMQQIFSTSNAYRQDIILDEQQHLSEAFEPGEVKFIEIK